MQKLHEHEHQIPSILPLQGWTRKVPLVAGPCDTPW